MCWLPGPWGFTEPQRAYHTHALTEQDEITGRSGLGLGRMNLPIRCGSAKHVPQHERNHSSLWLRIGDSGGAC